MINDEKYKEILSEGLIIDHYYLLSNLHKGTHVVENKRIQGFINLLTKKGYIKNGKLTDKAIELITVFDKDEEISVKKSIFKNIVVKKMGDWVTELHTKCQNKIEDLTGKKQVVSKVNKNDRKGYPFLCNVVDFGKVLSICISNYKLTDYNKIESTILNHIDKCHNANSWFPLMRYYIIKNGMSELVTDMNNDDQPTEPSKSTQKFV